MPLDVDDAGRKKVLQEIERCRRMGEKAYVDELDGTRGVPRSWYIVHYGEWYPLKAIMYNASVWKSGNATSPHILADALNRAGIETINTRTVDNELSNTRSSSDQAGPQDFREGGHERAERQILRRNPELRSAALKEYGYTCQGCEEDFVVKYGPKPACIEVHHTVPLSNTGSLVRDTKLRDVMVLCANCHSHIHRLIRQNGGKSITLDEFRQELRTQ